MTTLHCPTRPFHRRLTPLLGFFVTQTALAMTLLTEEFPPLNYSTDGGKTIVGTSTELIRHALHRAGTAASIEIHPWRYAYKRALEEKNTCVFSTSRTEEREPLFKWVGPLSEGRWVLYAHADSPLQPVTSLAELKTYVIGGYQGDARTQYLKARGLTIDEAQTEQQSLKKLGARRVDLWSATSNSGPWHAQQLGIPIRQIIVFRTGQSSYLACNPSVPDEWVARLNAELRALRTDGTYQKIMESYYGPR